MTGSGDDMELPGDLAIAIVRFARHLRLQRRDSMLSLSQLSALTVLHREGAMTPGALAVAERVSPPSLTRVLVVLDETGMITRHPHPTDGRVTLVSITALGIDTVTTDATAGDHWLRERLDTLTPPQLEVLRAAAHAIEKILTNDRKD